MTARSRPPVVVVGVGSRMRGDDGIGPAAVDLLGERLDHRSDVELVRLDGEPGRLIEALREREVAVVIDAVATGADPGTIHRVDPNVVDMPHPTSTASTHSGGVAEAVRLAAVLDRLPARLVVLGIEPGDLTLGQPLSDRVQAALPALVDEVLREMDR